MPPLIATIGAHPSASRDPVAADSPHGAPESLHRVASVHPGGVPLFTVGQHVIAIRCRSIGAPGAVDVAGATPRPPGCRLIESAGAPPRRAPVRDPVVGVRPIGQRFGPRIRRFGPFHDWSTVVGCRITRVVPSDFRAPAGRTVHTVRRVIRRPRRLGHRPVRVGGSWRAVLWVGPRRGRWCCGHDDVRRTARDEAGGRPDAGPDDGRGGRDDRGPHGGRFRRGTPPACQCPAASILLAHGAPYLICPRRNARMGGGHATGRPDGADLT